jgi:hypothetical protein
MPRYSVDDRSAGPRHPGRRDHPRRTHRGRHVRNPRLRPWVTAALFSLAALATGVVSISTLMPAAGHGSVSPDTELSVSDATGPGTGHATRGHTHAEPTPAPSVPVMTLSLPAPPATASLPPTRHKPVAGLSQIQTDHATVVIDVAVQIGIPKRAWVVAITTALQETRLRNLANPTVPQSLSFPNQGVESNFDSIGLFQQRPSQGWGAAAQLMDPATSARLFYDRLLKVPGWESMSVGAAAQAVQRSAFPNAYDAQQAHAQRIVAALNDSTN